MPKPGTKWWRKWLYP